MLLRGILAGLPAILLTLSPSALAGPKLIHLPPPTTIPTLSGPVNLHDFGGTGKGFLFPGLAPSLETSVIFPAARPWTDRRYLRGPDFPTMTLALQSRIEAGPSVPNASNPYRQRIPVSVTVANGSLWAGVFRGGPTAQGGSVWRNRSNW